MSEPGIVAMLRLDDREDAADWLALSVDAAFAKFRSLS